jgi:disease resistance protein RPM1
VYELEPLSDIDSKRLLYSLFEAEHLEGIGNLCFLKTLDLSTVYIDELPASIIHLRQLEHLLVQTDVKLPDGIGKLRLLQELSWLNVKMSPNNLVELGNLSELRVLRISGLHKNES